VVVFLTVDELRELTGRERRKDQLAWLKAKGYKHEINALGHIKVLRSHVEHKLGAGKPPEPSPDFTVFQKQA
jgi:hypothetical protein